MSPGISRWPLALRLVLLALAVAALAGLGAWQIVRGQQKQALLDDYARAKVDVPQPLQDAPTPQPGGLTRPVSVRGHYLAGHELLLDNQVQNSRAGYDVWTPLQLADGRIAMIDRGWIARGESPAPPPQGDIDLHGLLRSLPEPGMRLGADNCAGAAWPRIVEYPRAGDLECLYKTVPVPGVVLLDPAAPGGFVRNWQPTEEFPPSRHYGYAVQWFGLSATLLVLSLIVLFKSSKPAQ